MKVRSLKWWAVAAVLAIGVSAEAHAGQFPFLNEVTLPSDSNLDNNAGRVELVDLDGDGLLDVLVSGNELSWYQSEEGFTEDSFQNIIAPGTPVGQFATGDIDGDGDVDIVSVEDGLRWIANDAGAKVWIVHDIETEVDGDVVLGDADADGDLDLFHLSDYPAELRLFVNEGGTFGAPLSLTVPSPVEMTWIEGGDFDDDGDVDLFIGNHGYEGTSLFRMRNDGNGLQWTDTQYSVPNEINMVKVVDRDSDGDLDLLLGLSTKAVVYDNYDGEFAIEPIADSGNADTQWTLDVGDADADGSPDIFSLNQAVAGGPGAQWFDADFQPTVISEEGGNPRSIAVGDVDGDDDDDVVAFGKAENFAGSSNSLRVFVNMTDPDDVPDPDDGGSDDGGSEEGGNVDDGGSDDAGDDGGPSTSGDDGGAGDETGGGPGAAGDDDGDEESGGCRVSGSGGPPAVLLLLLATSLVLRRRVA